MPKFTSDSERQKTKTIIVGWLVRDFDFSHKDAENEFENILASGSTLAYVTKEFYLTISRIGFKALVGGRKTRESIYMSLENAINHAAFIPEDAIKV